MPKWEASGLLLSRLAGCHGVRFWHDGDTSPDLGTDQELFAGSLRWCEFKILALPQWREAGLGGIREVLLGRRGLLKVTRSGDRPQSAVVAVGQTDQ